MILGKCLTETEPGSSEAALGYGTRVERLSQKMFSLTYDLIIYGIKEGQPTVELSRCKESSRFADRVMVSLNI